MPAKSASLEKQAQLIERVERRTGYTLGQIATKIGIKERTLYKGKLQITKLSSAVIKLLTQMAQTGSTTRVFEEASSYQTKQQKKIADQMSYICQNADKDLLSLFESVVDAHYKLAVKQNKKPSKS